jgi:carbamoyl-phosphate synthase/aspartate carbamoyltransferase
MSKTTPMALASSPPALPASPSTTLASRAAKSSYGLPGGLPIQPVTYPPASELNTLFPGPDKRVVDNKGRDGKMLLELADGTAFEGFGFGKDINVSGECVFTTGEYNPCVSTS